jgi:hypothetical protein
MFKTTNFDILFAFDSESNARVESFRISPGMAVERVSPNRIETNRQTNLTLSVFHQKLPKFCEGFSIIRCLLSKLFIRLLKVGNKYALDTYVKVSSSIYSKNPRWSFGISP